MQVYLAMEAGYMEKVEELCQRYSLEGYVNSLGNHKHQRYLSYINICSPAGVYSFNFLAIYFQPAVETISFTFALTFK